MSLPQKANYFQSNRLTLVMSKKFYEIASADDGEIGSELLDWSGLSQLWETERLGDYYSFLNDVAMKCDYIDLNTEQWGGDAPGLSGVWYNASTKDSDMLRKEMEAIAFNLIEQKNSQEI
jgi:hypothetical protein